MWTPEESGIEGEALRRYVEEQIYALPGADRPRDTFSVLLTGSRAIGTHTDESDVDLEVLCPQAVYDAVHRACREAGVARAEHSFFHVLRDGDPKRYFGAEKGNPHFSLIPLEVAERQVRDFEDVWLWTWTHAKVIADPGGQFRRVVERFTGYPRDVLVRKIKYRWLLAGYWAIEVGGAGLANAVHELLRLGFLVEGRPFPYPRQLMRLAAETKLGEQLCPILEQILDLVVGRAAPELEPEERFQRAFEMMAYSDTSPECQRIERACADAMIAAGVEPEWVAADYDNINELLLGNLGPVP